MEQLLDKCENNGSSGTHNNNDELRNNPLFKRTSKLFSDSDPDILDDRKIDQTISASKSLTLPLSRCDQEDHFRDRAFQIDSPTSPVAKEGVSEGHILSPPF